MIIRVLDVDQIRRPSPRPNVSPKRDRGECQTRAGVRGRRCRRCVELRQEYTPRCRRTRPERAIAFSRSPSPLAVLFFSFSMKCFSRACSSAGHLVVHPVSGFSPRSNRARIEPLSAAAVVGELVVAAPWGRAARCGSVGSPSMSMILPSWRRSAGTAHRALRTH